MNEPEIIEIIDGLENKHEIVEAASAAFGRDGFVLLSRALPDDILNEWQNFGKKHFEKCFSILYDNGHIEVPFYQYPKSDLCGRKGYTLGLGAKHGFREIVMRSPGRYELSLLNLQRETLESLRPQIPDTAPILRFLGPILPKLLCGHGMVENRSLSDIKQCHLSLLIATPDAADQSWHADGGHVCLSEHLPCHCFNVFIPLHDIPLEMGPTEFRPGGHFLTRNLAPMILAAKCRRTLRRPVWNPLQRGDVLLFDYRVLHRGRANKTDTNRMFLVLTFCEPWFKDVLNFPTRSMMEPAIA